MWVRLLVWFISMRVSTQTTHQPMNVWTRRPQTSDHKTNIKRAQVGHCLDNGQLCQALTTQLIMPCHDMSEQTGWSPDSEEVGHPHMCSQNLMNDPAVVKTVDTEGGMVGTSMLLGQVVNPPVSPNSRQRGDYTAVLLLTHGGMPNSSLAITVKTGTEMIPALLDRIWKESDVVPQENMWVAPGEMAVNLVSLAPDTETPVEVVYDYGALPATDNMPLILASRWLTERGVDTAIYLMMKHTDGYGVVAGGVTADVGKPDRPVYVDKPLGPAELDELHYGSAPVEWPGSEGVPTMKRIVQSTCDTGSTQLLQNVPHPNSGPELSYSWTLRYVQNVPVAVEPPQKQLKAALTIPLDSLGDKHYECVQKHSLNGSRGATVPETDGGWLEVSWPTYVSKSTVTEIYAVDVCSRRSNLLMVMYCQTMDEQSVVVGTLVGTTCSLAGTEDKEDSTVDTVQVPDVTRMEELS